MENDSFWAPYWGAVSLTFDDGRPTQLANAIPLMDEAGLRGTFYLNPSGKNWMKRMEPWVEVGRRGHEIGNHTLSHVCTNNLWGERGGLEDRTLEEIEADIVAAQERLVQVAPQRKDWTFCYPCYNAFVGEGVARRSYVPVVAKRFLAGRGAGEYGFANFPRVVDLACVGSTCCTRMGGFEMIGLVEALAARGLWQVLVFHEIDGSHQTTASWDFKLLLDYLRRRSNEVWCAPVAEVARKIADARGAGAAK